MASQSAEHMLQTGIQCQRTGQVQHAISVYRQLLFQYPNHLPALCNLAVCLSSCGQYREAAACYERALELKPDYAEVHNNLGNLYKSIGRTDRAVMHLERALRLMPHSARINNNLGNLLKSQGRIDDAINCLRKALALQPDYIEARSNLLFTLNYSPDISPQDLYNAHIEFATKHCTDLPVLQQHDNELSTHRRLRIGYISGDFRQHSVACFITPVLQQHNHEDFEILAYHNHRTHDFVTDTIRQSVDQWREIAGRTDDQVLQLVRNDRIDILVDLSGHTAHNRLPVFARKAAPVQVTWIGYPTTTGLPTMDFRITDDIADPPGIADSCHTERLIRFPECFSVYQGPAGLPIVGKTPALRNGYITFGSFNNMAKIHNGVLALWSDILRAIPASRLVLKSHGLEIDSTRHSVREVFISHGIATDRLDLLGTDATTEHHLQRYNEIDIGLDPFPYNGTTTTCEALLMGVPVITLKGDRHAGRVGASLMQAVGLDECVTGSPEEYVSAAVQWAGDLGRLSRIRSSLRSGMENSPLMNAERFTLLLENEFRNIWKRWCLMHKEACP